MTEASDTSPTQTIVAKGVVPLILSRELRWLYFLGVGFLGFLGATLFALGAYYLTLFLFVLPDPARLTSGIVYIAGGMLAFIVAIGAWQVRRYLYRINELALAQIKSVELGKIKEEDFEKFDEINRLRAEKAQVDFERNVKDTFLVGSFQLSGVDFFGDCSWTLKPGVNILLGRNGYGKSLILRSLAGLLQRNEEASKDLFVSALEDAFLQLTVERNGVSEIIRRGRQRFTESIGKIPILAIPDSRFVNRSETVIEAPKHDATDLRANGALHFLEDRPYGEMMHLLFNELCFDYLERQSFDQPVFGLMQKAVETLTADRFRFHAVERVGRNTFRLLVVTEGNDRPVPIQYASQGTLSVLGVVGIVRSYLQAVFPETRDEDLLKKPAIVFIDELDAHLHPLWQQKLTSILRDNFPNVQFVLSAHSPLVVAGCWNSEVTVLRKGNVGFEFEQLDRDFIGTPAAEIYKVIFDVEDIDQNFLRFASRATSGFSNQERISELENKQRPTEVERLELVRLIREEGIIRRAAEVKADRETDQDRILELEAQVDALKDKLTTST